MPMITGGFSRRIIKPSNSEDRIIMTIVIQGHKKGMIQKSLFAKVLLFMPSKSMEVVRYLTLNKGIWNFENKMYLF